MMTNYCPLTSYSFTTCLDFLDLQFLHFIIAGLISAGYLLCRSWLKLPKFLSNPRLMLALICLMSLSINVYTAYHVLETFPNSGDEYAYKYASDIMLEGRVTLEATEKQSLLHPFGFKQIEGKLVSKFPPGWPAVLTFFRALGVPVNLVNPILSLLCLILVSALEIY